MTPTPITVQGSDYRTVQDALLFIMRAHDRMVAGSFPYTDAQLRRHLWDSLSDIRNSIAARAPADEMELAA